MISFFAHYEQNKIYKASQVTNTYCVRATDQGDACAPVILDLHLSFVQFMIP